MKQTSTMANARLTAMANELALGFLYIFAGPVPAAATDLLDLTPSTGLHTQLVKITVSSGATGLSFDTAVANVLSKPAGVVWSGLAAFSGKESSGALVATFARFVEAADEGTAGASGAGVSRLQLSVGGPSSGLEVTLGNATITHGSTTQVIDFAQLIDDLDD